MKQFFQFFSIRKKLTLAIMASSLLVLLLVSSFYIYLQIHSSRTTLIRETAILAKSLGENSRRFLLLNQFREAEQVLASLKLQPNIHAAYLFDDSGQPVAEYLDQFDSRFLLRAIPLDFAEQNRSFWTDSTSHQVSSDWQHLGLYQPIFHDEQRIGTLYLLSDLQALHDRINAVVFSVLIALALLAVCSWWLSGILQKPVSDPLLALVETMKQISRQNNYHLRAVKHGPDEIGLLVDGFNQMLDKIEQHRTELEGHQKSLEKQVLQRTKDLTRTVEQLQIAKQQAEMASKEKSQFLANMTHELRTPLNGVLGMNELLFRTGLNEQQEMLAKTVQRSGEDLLRSIDAVLDFSRIESGQLELDVENFAFYQVVEEVVALLWPQAQEKGVQLHADIPLSTTWEVRGDKNRVRQIVMNLLGNAIKFTHTGAINLRLSLAENSSQQAACFSLEVEDSGIGMDSETQKRIFSAFYQADSSITREYGGAGLGLGIVRQLVDLMQGSISCESRLGQGSRFRVSLPLPLIKRNPVCIPVSLQHQQVLLQEANPQSRHYLLQRLSELGLSVLVTSNAADAWYQLEAAKRRRQPFSLLILSGSARLPDGQKLLEAIHEEGETSCLRRILLLDNDAEKSPLGNNEVRLYRPITWSSLLKALHNSYHELRLVPAAPQQNSPEGRPTAGEDRITVAVYGGSVASQELIRLALQSTSWVVDVVDSLTAFIRQSDHECYQAVIVDLRPGDIEPLLDLLGQQPLSNLIVLHQPGDPVEPLRQFAAGVLERPLGGNALQAMLGKIAATGKDDPAAQENL